MNRKQRAQSCTICLAATLVFLTGSVRAQVEVSGSLDVVTKRFQEYSDFTNNTFAGQNAFSTIRGRLFFESKVSENASVFLQLFSDGGRYLGIYGAYLRLEHLFGSGINLQAGRIPNTIGTWGARTYSNLNPLIGVPVVWNHHTTLAPYTLKADPTIQDLLDLRDIRPTSGLPVLYDFCWNGGIELYTSVGQLDLSIAALAGSVSNPATEQIKLLPQGTAHVTLALSPGFIVGASGFYGPYLSDHVFDEYAIDGEIDPNDFINMGGGGDLYLAHGLFEFYSEVYYTNWEYPNLPDLSVIGGYVEGKYKFSPGWYLAARYDQFDPSKIQFNDEEVNWDYPVKRYEFGIGHKPSRNLTVKAVTQLNRLDQAPALNIDHYALQLALQFR